MTDSACPDDAKLGELLRGGELQVTGDSLERHVGECARCQARLEDLAGAAELRTAELARVAFDSSSPSPFLDQAMRRLIEPQAGMTPGPSATVRQPRLERYEVQAVIGAGGMGAVFRGRDPRLKRAVAIKTLRVPDGGDAGMAERFLREAEAIAAIRSDYVVSVFDLGVERGVPFLVMELVDGGSLAEQIERDGRLPFERVVKLAKEVAAALAAAHTAGVIHRDVKPRNVLYDAEADRYKLTDFGLVKFQDRPSMTATGAMAGTPEYMSPEQAEGKPIDARSDLFSLGGLLYAACTGASPFQAESAVASIMRVCRDAPRPLDQIDRTVPAWFAQLVAALLEKNPERRPGSAAELLRSLENQSAPAASMQATKQRTLRYATAGVALIALGGVALATRGYWSDGTATHATNETATAQTTGESAAPGPFRLAGRSTSFTSLNAAVDEAATGDVIEVHGDGPYPCLPIALGDKALTLRAAAAHPVLVFTPIDPKEAKPAIGAANKLALEGLELRWMTPARASATAGFDTLVPSALHITGDLELTNCIVTVAQRNTCLRWGGARCTIRRSRLAAPQGVALAWRPKAGAKLDIAESEISAESCLSVSTDASQFGANICDVTWSANTFAGDRLLRLRGAAGPKFRLATTAERNRFDVKNVMVMEWTARGPRGQERPNIAEVRNRLPRYVSWRERANLYASPTRFIAHESLALRLATITDGPSDIASWEQFWGNSSTGSIQGDPPDSRDGDFGAKPEWIGPKGVRADAGDTSP